MARSSNPLRAPLARAAVVLMLATVAAVSCSKKGTLVDPSAQPPAFPEGVPSPSQLVVYRDTPNLVYTYLDRGDPGPSFQDTLLSVRAVYTTGQDALQGRIFDYTNANAYEVFRRESNGGYREFKDFTFQPFARWLDSHSDLLLFADPHPVKDASPVYLGRGVVAGAITTQAPLTNLGRVTLPEVSRDLDYTGLTQEPSPPDSLFKIQWAPVAGAAGYWLHVYQFSNDLSSGDEVIASGIPSPIYAGKSKDYLVAFVPGTANSYTLGDPVPPGGRILTRRTTIMEQFYSVKVSAVDADGQLLACTGDLEDFGIFRTERTYDLFPLGAAVVNPKRPPPPPSGGPASLAPSDRHRAPLTPAQTGIPNLWIYPRAALPPGIPR